MSRLEKPRLSFLGLLSWFMIFFLIGPLFPGFLEATVIQVSFSIMILFAVFTMRDSKMAMIIGGAIALVSSAANGYVLYQDTFRTEFWALLTSIVFTLFAVVYLFHSIFLSKVVDKDLIFGSLCIYILLAILFALIYQIIELVSPGSFQDVFPAIPHIKFTDESMALKFHAFLYYSFVTQTTLGYGDITPVTPIAKNFAAIQAVIGVFYLATIVGGIVSLLIRSGGCPEAQR
ncbi:MAG: ion channel [Waddliaceae bacterium]